MPVTGVVGARKGRLQRVDASLSAARIKSRGGALRAPRPCSWSCAYRARLDPITSPAGSAARRAVAGSDRIEAGSVRARPARRHSAPTPSPASPTPASRKKKEPDNPTEVTLPGPKKEEMAPLSVDPAERMSPSPESAPPGPTLATSHHF